MCRHIDILSSQSSHSNHGGHVMENSSLKLGTYSRKERFNLIIKDRRCWKAVGYALLTGLTLASTAIMFTLALAICINGIPSNPSVYIFPVSLILTSGIFLSPGTFLEHSLCNAFVSSTIFALCPQLWCWRYLG